MSILSRIHRIVRANIQDMLDRAENPVKIANYLIIEMQESLEQARNETASAMAAEKRLAAQAEDAERAAEQWEERARHAVMRGDDDLAREALQRRNSASSLAGQYHRAHQKQLGAVEQLQHSLGLLQQKMAEAKARRVELLAEVEVTRAQQKVARSLQQTSGDETFSAFDRLSGAISMERHRAIAMSELSRDTTMESFLIAEQTEAVEDALLSLKEECGCLEPPIPHKALEERNDMQG